MGGQTSTQSSFGPSAPNPGTIGGPTPGGFLGQMITPLVRQVVAEQQPPTSAQNPNITAPTTTEPQTYTPKYDSFGGTNPSSSGLAQLFSNIINSGAFQKAVTNPYTPQGTNTPINVPYGLQQQSMFNIRDVNPYGGTYGQGWNPYGNYYQSYNQYSQPNNTAPTGNNIAPPPNTTGPDALSQLNFMSRSNNQQI